MNAPLEIRLAHALERRIRVVIPALKGDQERFYLLEILLRKRPAIREIRSESRIGSLTIHFDPAAITRNDLLAAVTQIASVLARSERIALALQARGIGRGQRVGLGLERGIDLVPVQLGVLDFAQTEGLITQLMGKGEAAARRELMELHGDAIEIDV